MLLLTHSDEIYGDIPEEGRASRQTERFIEQETGKPAEVIPRTIWPSPQLPDIIDTWLERYSPDVVMFHINGFWYLYRSVPLLFERRFGRVGRYVGAAGEKAGRTQWLVETRGFHLTRHVALRTIGGATHFSANETVETVEACVRRIARHEGVGLVVRAPLAIPFLATCSKEALRSVDQRVRAVCDRLHVSYYDPDDPPPETNFWKSGDRLHTSAEGQAWYARKDAQAILSVWREAHDRLPR